MTDVAAYLAHEGLHNLLKMNDGEGALEKYYESVKKGHKRVDDKIEHLFNGGEIKPEDHSKAKKAIHEWMEKGGVTHDIQQAIYDHQEVKNYAEGGQVAANKSALLHNHPIATEHPEQNLMLQASKGRMSDYLNSLRPQPNAPKLAFDPKPDDKKQKKAYQKALQLAAHPLGILEEVQKGTLEPIDIGMLKNLHPEVYEMMQKKVTERITKDQLENKRPSHKVRQGLSMLLGAPLSSEMTPGNMQAIQATFQAKKAAQQQQQGSNKKGTSALTKVDDAYLTPNNARVARQQKQ